MSKGLARACKENIRNYRCRRLVSEDKGVRLAQILLCLENAIKNGMTKKYVPNLIFCNIKINFVAP